MTEFGRRFSSQQRALSLGMVGLMLTLLVAACNGNGKNETSAASGGAPSGKIELTLVGYAVPKAAHDAIIPKFVKQWESNHAGQTVTFRQSYGGSGSQTRAVLDGLEADVVHLALGADVEKLVAAGLVKDDWTTRVPNQGIVAETVAAIITRPGNPKQIKTFADLARADVKWVTPNPKTSGGARWNYYALWNQAKQTGGDDGAAQALVAKAFQNVVVLTKDARESTDVFTKQQQGDALVNYENEVILARQKGEKLEIVVPDVNISIDTPVAVVDKNVDKHGTRAAAEAFTQFLFTPEAQQEMAKVGFGPWAQWPKRLNLPSSFHPLNS